MMSNLGLHSITILCTIVLSLNPLFGQDFFSPEIYANRISQPIYVDGSLDDEAWNEASTISDDFHDYWIEYGIVAPVKTTILVGYDDENLYFGFICHEKEMDKVRSLIPASIENYEIVDDDQIRIHLNTDIEKTESYAFWVNPDGFQVCFYNVEEKPGLWGYAEIIDLIWYAAAKKLDSCWTVEVKIPFQSLRFPSNKIEYWRINFTRKYPREYMNFYNWAPLVKGYSAYTFYGKLHINDKIVQPKKVELLPYVTGGVYIDTTGYSNKDFTGRAGISGKYYFDYNNIIDWTIIPDFSQIESDAPQIDLNTTFAFYYPEKRPFFLERKAFFETPISVFYSRALNDLLCGLKYTGSMKSFSIGYVGAYDRNTPWIVPFAERSAVIGSDKKSFSNIIRIKKRLSPDSHFGIISVNRNLFNGGHNHVAGLDGNVVFLTSNAISFQGLVSLTKEPDDTTLLGNIYDRYFENHTGAFDGEQFGGSAFVLQASHKSKILHLNAYYKGLSSDFRSDNGFIYYNDCEERYISMGLTAPLRRYLIESIILSLEAGEKRRYFGEHIGFERSAAISINLKNQIATQFSYSLNDRIYEMVDFHNIWTGAVSLSITSIKNINLGMSINYGRQVSFLADPYVLGYKFAPFVWSRFYYGRLSLKCTYHQYILWISDYNNQELNTSAIDLTCAFRFAKNIYMRTLLQYNSTSNTCCFYPLFSYEATPFTTFYLGVNQTLENSNDLKDLQNYKNISTKIFLKLQHEFRP